MYEKDEKVFTKINKFIYYSSACPKLNASINTTCCCKFTFHVETTDEMVMSIIYLPIAPSDLQIPYPNRFIVGSTYQIFATRMEHNICYPVIMTSQRQNKPTGFAIEYPDLFIPCTCGDKGFEVLFVDCFGLSCCFFLCSCIDLDAIVECCISVDGGV